MPSQSAAIAPTGVGEDPRAWKKIIVPRRGFLDFPWRELWGYRDLIWTLAQRDLTTSYKQTILGPLWFVVQPLMVTLVFSYLFGRMAFADDGDQDHGTNHVPHYLFYMGGLVMWNYFSECINKASRSFTDNAQLFSKVYFPRLAVPLAAVLTSLIPLSIQFVLFLGGWVTFLLSRNPHVHPNWTMLLVPLMVVQVAMLGMGLGCLVASTTRRFRDMMFGLQLGLQLWMFGSGIVFPISKIDPDHRWLFYFLNPMVPIIESFRYTFVGVSMNEFRLLQPIHIATSVAITIVVFVAGVLFYNRAEQTAMDTV